MYLKILPTIVLVIGYIYLINNFSYYLLIIVLFLTAWFIYYDCYFYFKYLIFIVILTCLILIMLIMLPQEGIKTNSTEQWMTVTIKQETNSSYIVRYQNHYLMLKKYFFNTRFNISDNLRIFGVVTSNPLPNNFHQYNNFLNYYSKHIIGEIKLMSKEIYHYESLTIRNLICKWLVQEDSNGLISYYFLQKNTGQNDQLFFLWQQLNISHLLITSGFHINIQVILLNFILKKIIRNESITKIIIFLWLGFYVYLLNWQIAVLRAFLYWTVQQINYFFKQKLLALDSLAIVAISFLIFNPLIVYQLSFQFSFLVSAIIGYYHWFFKCRNWWLRKIGLQLIISISILPITIYLQGHINGLGWLHQLIFDNVIKVFYSILLIFMWIKPLLFLINYVHYAILHLTTFLHNWTVFFNFSQMPPWFYFIYYILIACLYYFYSYPIKSILMATYIIWWLCWVCVPYFNATLSVHMLNVGNALSMLIKLPYNQGNILFDAGIAGLNANNHLILEYLKKEGINSLAAIFISHQHLDHNNNLAYLQKHIKVNQVYTNKIMQKYYDVSGIRFENWAFNYYQQISKNDENNRSLVLFWSYQNHQLLFTGDLSALGESKILKYLRSTRINFLQVGHHGSNSSNTESFLKAINPETCVISAKKTKTGNVPHPSLMQRLQKQCREIYVTDINRTIIYQIKNYQHRIITLA